MSSFVVILLFSGPQPLVFTTAFFTTEAQRAQIIHAVPALAGVLLPAPLGAGGITLFTMSKSVPRQRREIKNIYRTFSGFRQAGKRRRGHPPMIGRRTRVGARMSAFRGKADINHQAAECPLIAIIGHSRSLKSRRRSQGPRRSYHSGLGFCPPF